MPKPVPDKARPKPVPKARPAAARATARPQVVEIVTFGIGKANQLKCGDADDRPFSGLSRGELKTISHQQVVSACKAAGWAATFGEGDLGWHGVA